MPKLHWGHEMAYTEAPHQLGLGFACKPNKSIPFIGRDAYLARKAEGKGPFLCSVRLADPAPLLHHNEPVLRDGEIVGYVTNGAYGATTGAAVGLCLISAPKGGTGQTKVAEGTCAVRIEGRDIPAELSLTPFYDPKNTRMLG